MSTTGTITSRTRSDSGSYTSSTRSSSTGSTHSSRSGSTRTSRSSRSRIRQLSGTTRTSSRSTSSSRSSSSSNTLKESLVIQPCSSLAKPTSTPASATNKTSKVRLVEPPPTEKPSNGKSAVTIDSEFCESIVFQEQSQSQIMPRQGLGVSTATMGESLVFEEQPDTDPSQTKAGGMGVSTTTMGESLVFAEQSQSQVLPKKSQFGASTTTMGESMVFTEEKPPRRLQPGTSTATMGESLVFMEDPSQDESMPKKASRFGQSTATVGTMGESIIFEECNDVTTDKSVERTEDKTEDSIAFAERATRDGTRDGTIAESLCFEEDVRSSMTPRQAETPSHTAKSLSDANTSPMPVPQEARPRESRTLRPNAPPYMKTRSRSGGTSRRDSLDRREGDYGWDRQLRGGPNATGRRNGSVPAWQPVNQQRMSSRDRGAYHGCTFGAPGKIQRENSFQREKGGYTQLRGIDEKRKEQSNCGKCGSHGHVARDCPATERENHFDPCGVKTKNLAGTFPPLPPVAQLHKSKVTPDLSGVTSRFRDWERSSTPPARSGTPTRQQQGQQGQQQGQQWKNVLGRGSDSAPNSPRKKEGVIKKLQEENKKLQRAIEQMKAKMTHLEELSTTKEKPKTRTSPVNTLPRSESRSSSPATAHEGRAEFSYEYRTPTGHMPRSSSPRAGSVSRSSSLPKKVIPVTEITHTRKAKTPQRTRGMAGTPVDWQRPPRTATPGLPLAPSYEDFKRTASIDRFSTPKCDQDTSRDVGSARRVHRTTSLQSPRYDMDGTVVAAVAPTLESRIQTLEAIQKDVRAALCKDGALCSNGVPAIPQSVQQLREGQRAQTLTHPQPVFEPVRSWTEDSFTPPAKVKRSTSRSSKGINRARERAAMLSALKPRWT